jgi:hypothetical protein
MAIGSNPVACFSVIGFVNMRYDRSNVNTFLVVLTCRIQQPSKKFPQNSNVNLGMNSEIGLLVRNHGSCRSSKDCY